MAKQYYKCEWCNSTSKVGGERKTFNCPMCHKKSRALPPEGSNSPIENKSIEQIQQELSEMESGKNAEFKTETVEVNVPSLPPQSVTPITNLSGNGSTSQQSTSPPRVVFSPESLAKWEKQFNEMMAKKDPDWDVTRGEEKVVAELWSDYLNTKFKDVPDENAKLLLAIGSTLTTYAPRAIGYATKIKAQRKPKKKEENEQTEPVQETETIKYEVNNNVFDQEAKKFEQDFSNRRPIQG